MRPAQRLPAQPEGLPRSVTVKHRAARVVASAGRARDHTAVGGAILTPRRISPAEGLDDDSPPQRSSADRWSNTSLMCCPDVPRRDGPRVTFIALEVAGAIAAIATRCASGAGPADVPGPNCGWDNELVLRARRSKSSKTAHGHLSG